jgi:predicted metal-dependent hydrolase
VAAKPRISDLLIRQPDPFVFTLARKFRAPVFPDQIQFDWLRPPPNDHRQIEVDGRSVEVLYQRNERAKRYRLYLDRHGRPRVTIPRRGNRRDAEQFLQQHSAWLRERLRRFAAQPGRRSPWRHGTEILLRGTPTALSVQSDGATWRIQLGTEWIPIPEARSADDLRQDDLRPVVELHFRKLAFAELPPRVLELAAQHQCPVRRIAIRNQATRWGSCSRRGTISLNWRLIQVPASVRDYIILHELMHLRELNHSSRFWAQVAQVCPDYEERERWLRKHSDAIL